MIEHFLVLKKVDRQMVNFNSISNKGATLFRTGHSLNSQKPTVAVAQPFFWGCFS